MSIVPENIFNQEARVATLRIRAKEHFVFLKFALFCAVGNSEPLMGTGLYFHYASLEK
jgi:hypothetical protein